MKSHCLASALLLLFGAVPGAFSADEPQLRGVAINSEDQLALKVFDTSEDFDLIDGHDEDSYFYQQPEDEYDEESFATATRGVRPLVKRCFRWHTDAVCRNGGRAGRCRDDWTEKCTYCERGEEVNKMTGKCVSSSDDDTKVERCVRWHTDAACRNGGRAGRCRDDWTEKCIMCKKDQEVNKMTGECVSISDDDKKVERCFRWHNSAACRNGGRAGYCSRSWTEKCIMCMKDQEVNKRTGECVSISDDDDKKVERCFRWHNSAACRNGGRARYCSRSWTEKCIMCMKDQEVNKRTGECAHNEMFIEEE